MSAAYRLTPIASKGFRRIVLYVEECFGIATAERVVDELERAFERLAANLRLGHRRDDLTSDQRILFWSVGPSLIAYRAGPERVEILFVERGELDWERMLAEHVEQAERAGDSWLASPPHPFPRPRPCPRPNRSRRPLPARPFHAGLTPPPPRRRSRIRS